MNIEIHQPELQAIIQQRMAKGRFKSIEDLLLQALKAMPEELTTPVRQNFTQFIQESPLWGSGLTIERQKDAPRPVDFG